MGMRKPRHTATRLRKSPHQVTKAWNLVEEVFDNARRCTAEFVAMVNERSTVRSKPDVLLFRLINAALHLGQSVTIRFPFDTEKRQQRGEDNSN